MKPSIRVLTLALAFVMMLGLSGVSYAAAEADRSITVTENWTFDAGFYPVLSPSTSTNYGIAYWTRNFYQTLVTYDKAGQIAGELAGDLTGFVIRNQRLIKVARPVSNAVIGRGARAEHRIKARVKRPVFGHGDAPVRLCGRIAYPAQAQHHDKCQCQRQYSDGWFHFSQSPF